MTQKELVNIDTVRKILPLNAEDTPYFNCEFEFTANNPLAEFDVAIMSENGLDDGIEPQYKHVTGHIKGKYAHLEGEPLIFVFIVKADKPVDAMFSKSVHPYTPPVPDPVPVPVHEPDQESVPEQPQRYAYDHQQASVVSDLQDVDTLSPAPQSFIKKYGAVILIVVLCFLGIVALGIFKSKKKSLPPPDQMHYASNRHPAIIPPPAQPSLQSHTPRAVYDPPIPVAPYDFASAPESMSCSSPSSAKIHDLLKDIDI